MRVEATEREPQVGHIYPHDGHAEATADAPDATAERILELEAMVGRLEADLKVERAKVKFLAALGDELDHYRRKVAEAAKP